MKFTFFKGVALGAVVSALTLTTTAALAGTGVGGVFNLGVKNSVNAHTTLTGRVAGSQLQVDNSSTRKGAAGIGIRVAAGKPPLEVNSSAEVAHFNAGLLDGKPASAFLPVTGTAANSGELGGTPASGYMQGGGDTTGGRVTETGYSEAVLVQSPAADLEADCDNDPLSGAEMYFNSDLSTTAIWWNKDGVGSGAGGGYVTPAYGSTTPYVVVVQVDNGTSISTFTASEWYDSGSDTCHFAGQVVYTSG